MWSSTALCWAWSPYANQASSRPTRSPTSPIVCASFLRWSVEITKAYTTLDGFLTELDTLKSFYESKKREGHSQSIFPATGANYAYFLGGRWDLLGRNIDRWITVSVWFERSEISATLWSSALTVRPGVRWAIITMALLKYASFPGVKSVE